MSTTVVKAFDVTFNTMTTLQLHEEKQACRSTSILESPAARSEQFAFGMQRSAAHGLI